MNANGPAGQGRRRSLWSLGTYAFFALGLMPAGAAEPTANPSTIQFNRDIRPILSHQCFHCHGFEPGKRKAGLRLDVAEGATAVKDGRQAVKPGDPDGSEMVRRISSTDPDVRMPPPETHKTLTPEEIAKVRQWIREGAAYQKHWAFETPTRPPVPKVADAKWARNDADRFILATLESKGLKPTAEAPRATLIRRVTLDLTGLPPTPEEVDAFLADTRPDAYEQLVDRLLQSPRYGEHMARYWLDVARYGDTHGLHLDNERSMWPYRDWVVKAFNENLPFDQFTIWQLAGDLLPEPTRDQLIASGFNRCNVSTSEGGAIDEEFQVRYAVDRVETTSTVWMGLTMGCAVCHDHKLDPITQKEFYQVFSIFNNISEKAMDGNALLPPPSLPVPSPEQERQLKELEEKIAVLDRKLSEAVATISYTDPATLTNTVPPEPRDVVWVEDDFPAGASAQVNDGNEPHRWVTRAEGEVQSGEKAIRRAGKGLHQVYFVKCETPLTVGAGDRFFAYVFMDPKDPPKAIMLQYHTDEWRNRANWGDADAIVYGTKGTTEKVQMGPLPETGKWVRLEVSAEKLGLAPGTMITGMAFTQFDGKAYWDQAGVVSVNDPAQSQFLSLTAWARVQNRLGDKSPAPDAIKKLVKQGLANLSEEDRATLRKYFLEKVYADPGSPLPPLRKEVKSFQDKKDALNKEIPATMISRELDKPRPAYLLIRGEYDKHGEPVGPGVPSILPPLPASEATNRLAFARWLVNPAHPLTGRVTVNRFWQQYFGTGLVKTAEDFGSKGDWPSHPELLDWLATEFTGSGWDTKKFVRMIVTSATYRQDSKVTAELVALDPDNRLLARGPRLRMDAEMVRDYALAVSRLLNLTTGGRGVRTYQPPGIWEAVAYTASNTAKYSQDKGDALYRRSLYLFWKRTAPPPMMTTFDAPSREQCRVRRERTNTPLQALLTLNDPQYFEAARHLGHRMLREGGDADMDRLRYGFRLVTARAPSETEASILQRTLETERARYRADEDSAKKVIAVGDSQPATDVPATELAAYTVLANLMLNLDEVLTKN